MNPRPQVARSRARRLALLVVSIATLAAALIVTIGLVGAAAGLVSGPNPGKLGPAGKYPIAGHKGHATCDEPGQPTCPPVPSDSVVLSSETPAAVLAALPTIPGYMSPVQADPALPANSTYSFDTPVLVLPATAGPAGNYNNSPHFIVRAAVNGVRMITYDLTYNPTTHALHIDSVGGDEPNDPHYGKPFPFNGVPASTAANALQTTHSLALASGYQPQLVFFDLNSQAVNPSNPNKWFGGGESPADPIWRLKGADKHLYFVGVDGHVYLPTQLPVAVGAVFAQP